MGNYSSGLVALLGISVVFLGLLLLVLVCWLLGKIFGGKAEEIPAAIPAAPAESPEDHGKLVAAIAVAIAEESGCDPAGLRIHSIKKIG